MSDRSFSISPEAFRNILQKAAIKKGPSRSKVIAFAGIAAALILIGGSVACWVHCKKNGEKKDQ
jgi:hypothetical protein